MPDDIVMQLSGPLVLQFTTTSKWFSHTLKTLMKNSIYNRVADNSADTRKSAQVSTSIISRTGIQVSSQG